MHRLNHISLQLLGIGMVIAQSKVILLSEKPNACMCGIFVIHERLFVSKN